ncbi:MAG: TetR/AcrR family transcriptional regulator [Candidatus Latescibacterota bacterium]|nr:MAG: TetR/AcrR family transcriptional regulator [Candidatus Latescibacterota bacterium]
MTPAKKISRKERERQQHMTEILQVAESVFAEKGYDRTRMSDIAKKAEFSVGYLYQTWEGKEDLYYSLVESKFKEFKRFVQDKIRSASDPYEQIDVLIDAHANFIEQNKAFAKIYLVETSPAEMRILNTVGIRLRRAHTHYLRLVEQIFADGIKKGTYASLPPRDLAVALEGMIFAFARDYLRNSSNNDFTHRIDNMKRIFFHSVLKNTRGKPKERSKS